jgi:transketolase
MSYGVIMKMAVQVADLLEASGKSVSVVSCHTVKPLDRTGIEQALRTHQKVIVIEEHVPQGGLAPQTKQIAWDTGAKCALHTFTLRDEFIHNFGSQDEHLAAHGLSIEHIMRTVS